MALTRDRRVSQVTLVTADSLCDPGALQHAAEAGWLLQAGNDEGFVPGEAAACLVLERQRDVTHLKAGQFALHRPGLSDQAKRWWPATSAPAPDHLANALSDALRLAKLAPKHISHLPSDMDGSSWRATAESGALNRVVFSEIPARPHWRPATLLGQTGTATALLDWLIPMRINQHDIELINSVLNWAIDPTGPVAACVIERAPA